MKEFLSKKEKGYWCSLAALLLSVCGLVFYRMLTAISFEQTEKPVIVIAFSFASILFDLIATYKDYGRVPSILAYAASTAAFFTLIEGRVSYLAFYFSGDVMNTGLSPFMVLSFLLFLAAMVMSLLGVIFKQEKAGIPAFSKDDLKVVIPMAILIAALCGVVMANVLSGSAEPAEVNAPIDAVHDSNPADSAQSDSAPAEETPAEPQANYKTPTEPEEKWQEYDGAAYAAEDVTGKTIAYQLYGDATVNAGQDMPFSALLNLYEDGEMILTVYGKGRPYTYYGYWTNMNDESLWFCVAHYTVEGQVGTCTIDYSYELTGHFDELTLNIALGYADGGQFVREMPFNGGDGTVKYATIEDFLTEKGWVNPAASEPAEVEPAEEAKEVLFSFVSDSENYLLDCYSDGTYTFTFVSAGLVETGEWSWKDWSFTLTDSNGKVTAAEMDDAHALNLHFEAAVNPLVNRDFTCDATTWGSAFGGAGSYEPT